MGELISSRTYTYTNIDEAGKPGVATSTDPRVLAGDNLAQVSY